MNVDTESSGSKKKEGQYYKRPGYFRNSHGRGAFNRYRHHNHGTTSNSSYDFNETNNNLEYSGATSEVTEEFSGLNISKSDNVRGNSKQTSNRYQYNSSRQTGYRGFSKEYSRGYNRRSYGGNQDPVEYSSATDVPNPSRRGQIVSGRYIRKQANQSQSNNTKTYRDIQSENNGKLERSVNVRQHSYKYGTTSINHENDSQDNVKEDSYREKNDERNFNTRQHSYKYGSTNPNRENDSQDNVKEDSYREKNDERNFITRQHSSYKYGSTNPNRENESQNSIREDSYNRDKNDYSSESVISHSPYHLRDYNKKYNNTYSCKYQNRVSSSEEMTHNYKKSYFKQRSSPPKSKKNEEDKATQRELLISRLHKGECECLVCCELIRTKDQIWHCLSCYHVFHLRCIKKWARSPAAAVEDGSWRCPACQSLSSQVPFNYYCFCGKCTNPEVNYHLTPHSCGEICDRIRSECSHHCKELCHPGPCPPCVIVVQKSCPCGKTNQTLPCNQPMETSCQYVCDKLLNCGAHRCKNMCHSGECIPCKETIVQKCYCGKNEQNVICTEDTVSCFVYSCGNTCNKELDCGHHTCNAVCHPGACQLCQMSIDVVKTCYCGKTTVDQLIAAGKAKKRESCQDPIPVCNLVCRKTLFCGPKENRHVCQSLCHEGECPTCPLTTSLKCSCGAFTKEFPCAEITQSFIYKCEKRCNRRKDCGRHKCLNNCCTSIEHKCELVCNKKLSCGLHQCHETCHMGNCPTCWNVSFDELRCHCGASVLYPPIHCGTKPPECSEPCTRRHPCEHDVKHTCHSDEKCPPCTYLTTKWCYGKHKQCGPVMCFLDGVSCGMPCQKPMPCGRHKCKLTCHDGECLKESEKCVQPCSIPRSSCGHPCNNPCHDDLCVETPCKTQVTSTCPCGRRSETATCFDSSKSYRLMSSTILATKMQEIKEGQSVNLSDVLGKKSKNNKLQCNEECAVIERNKRLAVALQIQNPDLSCSPGPPSYSEFLKDEAKKNPSFVSDVYDKLSNLVQLAKQSKQKCRSHSFPPMNRDQRRIVHELAEFFGCETQSYDEEPKRNVVVTAYKSRCWLPFINIMAIVQRDMGMRKGPAPILAQRDPKATSATSTANTSSGTSQKKKIDYFDYNE